MTDKQWADYRSGNIDPKPYNVGGPAVWDQLNDYVLLARTTPKWDPQYKIRQANEKKILKLANKDWRTVLNRDVLQRNDVQKGVYAIDTAAEAQ